MHEELILYECRSDAAVVVVDRERSVGVIRDDARRGAELAPEVQGLVGEPLATALGGLELVEGETGCLRARDGGRPEQAGKQEGYEMAHGRAHGDVPSLWS